MVTAPIRPSVSDETTVAATVEAEDETAVASTGLDDGAAAELQQVQRLSTLLDESITLPGGYRIGIDPLVGILPVVGDLSASAVSVYIVLEAVYLGAPRETVARMVGNVVVDTVFGAVPVVGPVFDAVYKANARNARLLEDRLEDPSSASVDRWTLYAVGLLLVGLTASVSLGIGYAAWWLAGQYGIV